MRRIVEVHGRRHDLEFNRQGNVVHYRFQDSPEREASIVEVEPGVYSILIGSASYEARVSPSGEGYFVDLRGAHIEAIITDPRESSFGVQRGHGDGLAQVKAPMPGKVVRVLVSPGDEVRPGQGLVVVEAMKMQNELKSPKGGRVVSLAVREAQAVAAGQVLVIVE